MKIIINDLINKYINNGWVVHPLSKPTDEKNSPGKRPLLTDWQKLTKTPDNIFDYAQKGYNLGLVCGKASGVIVLDFDSELFINDIFNGSNFKTLGSKRIDGRGHLYFKYNPVLRSQKRHKLDLEILSDGNNAVLPPSIHVSGNAYQWNDETAEPIEMPQEVYRNIISLFEREDKLNNLIAKCRPCYRSYWRDEKKTVHGSATRLFLGSFCSELYNKGADEELLKMFAKILYRKEYDEKKTNAEIKGWTSKEFKPWTCEKIKEQCSEFAICETCACNKQSDNNNSSDPAKGYKELDIQEILEIHKEDTMRRLNIDLPSDHFISEYITWLSSLSDGYRDYQIASAFWLLSAVTCGKIELRLKQEHIKPNLWVILIGKSTTSRKSTIVNKTRSSFHFSTELTLPNEDYSIEGYLETLSRYPVLNNVRDEAAGLMAKYHKKYNEGIFELECAIYDGQNVKKTLASGKNGSPKVYEIFDPYVTKLYATTSDNFSRYMCLDDFTCGYGYRFLYSVPNYKKERMDLDIESQEDIEMWGRIITRVKTLYTFFSKLDKTIEFKIEKEAIKEYNKIIRDLEINADKHNNDILNSAIGRAQVHILKLAILIEVGKNEMSLKINTDSVRLAANMVIDYFLPSLYEVIGRLQEDIKNNQIERIISNLRRLGGVSPRTRLLHDCKIKSKDFNECIQTMLEAHTIEGFKEKTSKVTFYRLCKNFETLTNPQNLQTLSISQNSTNEEILETSNKLRELKNIDNNKDIRARAPGACRVGFVRDMEILEISGISGISEAQSLNTHDFQSNAVTILKRDYDKFNKPGNLNDLTRLKENMKLKIMTEIEEIDDDSIERVINDYLKARGWA